MSYPPPPNNGPLYGDQASQPYGTPPPNYPPPSQPNYPPPSQPNYPPPSQPNYPPPSQPYGAPPNYQMPGYPQPQVIQVQLGMQESNGLAIASLVLGILVFVGFGILTGIPAVITGHMALGKIKENPALIGSKGQATAGLVLGYIGIGLTACVIIGFIALFSTAAAIPRTS